MNGSPAANPSMRPAPCSFCQRLNPADSKFCNACGAPLPLVPCERCGAVNEPGATACYQCAAPFPKAGGAARAGDSGTEPTPPASPGADGVDRDAKLFATLQELQRLLGPADSGAAAGPPDRPSLDTAKPAPEPRAAVTPLVDAPQAYPAPLAVSPTVRAGPPRVVRPWRLAAIVGTVALTALAVGGYYTLRERPVPDASAASGTVTGGGLAPSGALVDTPGSAGATAPAASAPTLAVTSRGSGDDQRAAPAPDGGLAAIRPGTAGSGDAPTAATAVPARSPETAAGPRPPGAEAKAPSAAAASAVARPRSAEAGPGVIERPPRVGPCTEAVAALGLCAPEAIQRRQ